MIFGNVKKLNAAMCPLCLALAGAFAPLAAQAAHDEPKDLTSVPLEQLMSMEVYSASKYVQRASQAPSSVTVISAAEIRDFGWRTLADVARSVRGLYVGHDRNYSYLGARGFMRPGDYNTRFLLQIDGNRINDAVYDQAPLGGEFPLDLELVERIEFVPGPGSSIYGSNAFFGVINVITKKGGDLAPRRVEFDAGGAGLRRAAASLSGHGANGAQYLLSISRARSDGKDLYYPEFDTPRQNHGVAHRLDHEDSTRAFASASYGAFQASAMQAERTKGVPTASFGQAFNDPRSQTVDRQRYLNMGWNVHPGHSEELKLRAFWGSYDSFGNYIADDAARTLNHDGSQARWWGAELSLHSTRWAGHTVLAGLDLQRDYRLAQYSYDAAPYYSYLDQRRSARRAGLYLQDEMTLADTLRLTLGMRYDRNGAIRGVFSPRAALIWQLTPSTTIKAIHGSAFRAPNSYEMYYAYDGEGGQLANPGLRRERIHSSELALVQQLAGNARLTVTTFRNKVSELITQVIVPERGMTRFDNLAQLSIRGSEVEYEHGWTNGATLRASVSWSQAGAGHDDVQIAAPTRLAKLNAATPLPWAGLRAAVEAQYVGARTSLAGAAPAFVLANANLVSTSLLQGLLPKAEVSLGIYNLLDRSYADPGSVEHVQRAITQDRRRLRVRVAYAF